MGGDDNFAKTTYIGGDYIEIIKGKKTEYVLRKETHVNKQYNETAKEGKKHVEPESPPKTENKIYDIVMFVAGTTDPVNTKSEKHQANTNYWRVIDEKTKKEREKSVNNIWYKIKELKPQYLNLHIEGEFFSWSGDNDTKERNKAAERLLNLFLRVYKFWKNQEVHLHLIGHSHGGNVINQFTELIATDKDFPKDWKVKSITYLSTPFFQKKHQLNHAKLHKSCKIINVHNEYDLTQQLIADFSLVNLEGLLKSFQMEKFKKGIDSFKSVNMDNLKPLYSTYIEDKKEGPAVWKETAKGLLGINQLTLEFINYINSINLNKPSLHKERDSFVSILNSFLKWTYDAYNTFTKNSVKRKGGYGRSEFVEDLNLAKAINNLNRLFYIKTNEKDSYLFSLLAKLFAAESGVTDTIEVASWTPKNQTKGLSIKDVNITKFDEYDSRGKKELIKKFVSETSNAVHNNNLEEVLLRLFSQMINPQTVTFTVYAIHLVELYFTGDEDDELKKLRGSIEKYKVLINKYHLNLVSKADEKKFSEITDRPGSIPYLAMNSHSLSHTQFWKDVEEGLKDSFSSGKNTGYKKK